MKEKEEEIKEKINEEIAENAIEKTAERPEEKAGFDKGLFQKLIYVGLILFLLLLPLPQLFRLGEKITFTGGEQIISYEQDKVIAQSKILFSMAIYFVVVVALELIASRVITGVKQVPLAWWCVLAVFLAGLLSLTQVANSDFMLVALQGSPYRGEGLYSLCCYYLIFFAASLLKSKKYRKNIFLLFLIYGVFVSVLGVLQLMGYCLPAETATHMACIPLQNANLFAAFSVLFSGICMGGFLYYQEKNEFTHLVPFWNRIVWFVLAMLGFAACLSALSSVVYVGLIMMFLLLLFVEVVGKTRKFLPVLYLFLGFIAVMLLLNIVSGGRIIGEFFSVGEQIAEEGSIFGDSVGTNRMLLYKYSLEMLPECWLLGYGIEQLMFVFYGKYGLIDNHIVDRVHNEYLNLWMSEGILAVVAYLVFLFALFIPSLVRILKTAHKKESDVFRNIVFIGFFGYIAQAFFNIRAIQVAPYFWMFCGFLLVMKPKVEE